MDGTNRLGNNKYKDLPKIIEPYYKSNPNISAILVELSEQLLRRSVFDKV